MKYTFEGETYEYREKLTVEEAMEIYELSGMGVNQIDRSLALGIPSVVGAWMMILMRRANVSVTWEQVKKMDATSFRIVPEGDELAEAKKRVEELGKVLDAAEVSEQQTEKVSTTGKIRKRATSRTS